MSIYKRFCKEEFDSDGALTKFTLCCPENFNFGYDVLDVLAAENPSGRAMVWCDTDGRSETFTFADLAALSDRAANVLRSAGIRKGDRVLVVLKRQPAYWYLLPALHKLGAVAAPVTHMLTAEDFRYRLEYGQIRAVVAAPEEELWRKLEQAATASAVKPLLFTTAPGPAPFIDLTAAMAEAPARLPRQKTAAEEPLLMYFTSGTTGYPKAVIHDHSYPLSHIVTARYWQQVDDGGLHFTVAETGWAKAAWGKMYGQWLCGSAVMVYDFDNFDPRQLTAVINRFGVTSFCAPPTVYRYLVKKGMEAMPGLRHAVTAGEALSPEVFHRFQERTGLALKEGYGQTETALILANFAGMPSRPGSLGKASPLYQAEVLREDGTFAGPDEPGELVLIPADGRRPPGVFTTYYGDEALYNHVWRDGVYHTGDVVWRDQDGYFWFQSRIDDVIKSGGYRIGPYEIENILLRHDAVLECSVVGVRDDLRGQAIKAFVLPAAGYRPDSALQKELREYCNARLAEYKWIRSVEFVRELPKTISGKIRKTILRQP